MLRILCILASFQVAFTQEDTLELSIPTEAPITETHSVPAQDSLLRQIALIDIARGEVAAASTDFWHRLIPRVLLSGSLGGRDLLFPDPAGGVVLPRDSYRISISFAPLELFDDAKHSLALLQLEEARTRHALLLKTQARARITVERKRLGLTRELGLAREEADLAKLLLEYHELMFKQGKDDFPALTRSRLSAVRARANLLELERRIRELDAAIP